MVERRRTSGRVVAASVAARLPPGVQALLGDDRAARRRRRGRRRADARARGARDDVRELPAFLVGFLLAMLAFATVMNYFWFYKISLGIMKALGLGAKKKAA